MHKTLILLACTCLVAVTASETPSIGYRGGIRRTASAGDGPLPPTTCDGAKGTNIRWRSPLPNWGYGCPIVTGGKVFLTTEGGHVDGQDFPRLHCFDLGTGTHDWEVELNHLAATGHTDAAKDWAAKLAHYRELYGMYNTWKNGDEATKKATEEKWSAMNYSWGGWKQGYGALRSLSWKGDRKSTDSRTALTPACKEAGFGLDSWLHSCGMGLACFGQSFATPVSDGEAVYVATAFDSFFKVGFDGKIKWVTFDLGIKGEYCRTGRSPLIYGDWFISDMNNVCRALDRKTGKIVWKHEVAGHVWLSPAVITVDGKDILLVFNQKAFLLPGGQELTVEGGSDFGNSMSVLPERPNVSFHTGSGEHSGWTNKGKQEPYPPAAVEWSLEGTTLKGKVLWSGIAGKPGSGHCGLTLHQGKLFHAGAVFDPLTGKILAGKPDDKKSGLFKTKHLLVGVGDRLYGMDQFSDKTKSGIRGGTISCYGLDGKLLGEGFLPCGELTREKKDIIKGQGGEDSWAFSYSYPFTIAEGCVVVRGNDDVWCIGK